MWRDVTLILGVAVMALALLSVFRTASAGQPEVGQPAPGFRLQDQAGHWTTLEQHAGRWVVLYFYPKADTPGCTREACEFRDNLFAVQEAGATILGISVDPVAAQKKFADKYSLPFPLLVDIGGGAAAAYGVLTSLMGLKIARRQSFIIAPDGTVARHYRKVDPGTHTAEVLADLRQLQATTSRGNQTGSS